jgi:molybdate transport system substrate-binding protein
MEDLREKGLVLGDTLEPVVRRNKLALITGKEYNEETRKIEKTDFTAFGQIAVGNPETVPAGEYTKETLEQFGIRESLEEQFVFAKDVRQVLTYVETGNADAGFVYYSDAKLSDRVYIAAEADDRLHEDIVYPGAVLSASENPGEASLFLEFLLSPSAQAVFTAYGFGRWWI